MACHKLHLMKHHCCGHRPQRGPCLRAAALRPEIFNLALSGDLQSYSVQEHCWVAFSLSVNVTGFQDIQYYSDGKGGAGARNRSPFCVGHHGLGCLLPRS